MLTFWKRLKRKRIPLDRLALVASLGLTVLALPWVMFLFPVLPDQVLGIDGGYFTALFIIPVLMGIALLGATRAADDTERHMRKFENE